MTAFPAPRLVRCPICMDLIPWTTEPTVLLLDAELHYRSVELPDDPLRREGMRRTGYRRCPSSPDTSPHYLPATYGEYRDPLVIGIMGESRVGKTHLLTAMIYEMLFRGGLGHGFSVEPLDFQAHDQFTKGFIQPFEQGFQLPGTDFGVTGYAESLLVRRGQETPWPLTFFDVAGGDLRRVDDQDRSSRFLLGASAYLFVLEAEDRPVPGSGMGDNRAFQVGIAKASAANPNLHDLPAAIVVNKSDRLRFRLPADRWITRGPEQDLDAARIRDEARDVYAYLDDAGQASALGPFETFDRCTLHFVSASGGDVAPNDRIFPRGIQPLRVLEPLVALLAMLGVVSGPAAQKVGQP